MTTLAYFFAAFDYCRAQKKLKQKEVAEIIGISENDLSRYRNFRRSMDDALKAKITEFFGFDLLDFLLLGRSIMNGDKPESIKQTQEISPDRELELLRKNEALSDRIELLIQRLEKKDIRIEQLELQVNHLEAELESYDYARSKPASPESVSESPPRPLASGPELAQIAKKKTSSGLANQKQEKAK